MNKTYEAFFRRVKRGEKAGYPRFKSSRRFDSITFPSYGDGIKLHDNMLRIQGIGPVEVKLHRPVGDKIKTVTIKRECGEWYACFSVECEAKPLSANSKEIGIDIGLEKFATMSDHQSVPNPRWYQRAEAQLRRAQRRVARRKKGSHRRGKAVALLQKIHQRIKNQRHEFQHKFTFWLVQNFGVIAVEDLNVKGLAGGMLAKSVQDVSSDLLTYRLGKMPRNHANDEAGDAISFSIVAVSSGIAAVRDGEVTRGAHASTASGLVFCPFRVRTKTCPLF